MSGQQSRSPSPRTDVQMCNKCCVQTRKQFTKWNMEKCRNVIKSWWRHIQEEQVSLMGVLVDRLVLAAEGWSCGETLRPCWGYQTKKSLKNLKLPRSISVWALRQVRPAEMTVQELSPNFILNLNEALEFQSLYKIFSANKLCVTAELVD